MNEWIEINLPWGKDTQSDLEWPEYLSVDLDKEIKEQFGYTEEELISRFFGEECSGREADWVGTKTYDTYFEQSQKMRDKLRQEGLDTQTIEKELNSRLLSLNNKKVSSVIEFFSLIRPINAFIKGHEKTHQITEQNEKIREDFETKKKETAKNFQDRGLAKAGILMDVSEKGLMLIGDINELGGSCDDCRGISNQDIIKRYQIVYTAEQ